MTHRGRRGTTRDDPGRHETHALKQNTKDLLNRIIAINETFGNQKSMCGNQKKTHDLSKYKRTVLKNTYPPAPTAERKKALKHRSIFDDTN